MSKRLARCEPLIYQATLFGGGWQGRADFLRRTAVPSDLGDYSYEVLDTKLARQVKPEHVHQLMLYGRLVATIQGLDPEYAYIVLGDGETETIRPADYSALHRHVAATLERIVNSPAVETYPEPVAHCGICDLEMECRARWVADDRLSLVAGAHRERRERLIGLGIETVAELTAAPAELEPGPLGSEQFELLRSQAALQVESRTGGNPTRGYLEPVAERGYGLLPDPSPGDIFFDLEGDPYVGTEGIEYLWGWWTEVGGYEHIWAHGADAEKQAFETFVDLVVAGRDEYPDLHVYHYAAHERSKLGSLATKYATREIEVDRLLAEKVLVDLLAVVRQGMQVGEESYSLKKLERHHEFVRKEHRVREGGGSIVAYENWLATGEVELLEAIRAYNEEDCLSTSSLRDWLVDVTIPEAEEKFEVDFRDYRKAEPAKEWEIKKWLTDLLAVVDRLAVGLAAESDGDSVEEARRRMLSHLLLFHRRETNPEYWRFFSLRQMSVLDLVGERDAVAGLERDESVEPECVGEHLDYSYRFPPQEAKLGVGTAEDPIDGGEYKISSIGSESLKLRCAAGEPPPSPEALVPGRPVEVAPLRKALVALAESVLAGEERFQAAVALIDREPPRTAGGELSEDVDELAAAAIGLDHSILPIQGPPGTGKTYRGARMVLAALAAGRRVAITAPSHAAMTNLLAEIEDCAAKTKQTFKGVYKGYQYESKTGFVELVHDNKKVTSDYELVAGSAWLLARPEHREQFGLLFIDEASQYSLANALAASVAAENVVLLGDPQQLPQVTKASHPGGSGAAVLEHLLDSENTIQPGRGVLLTTSWRMHPAICTFVSERSYESRLSSREECSRRNLTASQGPLSGVGLRAIPLEHEGRSQRSVEEAEVIAGACEGLLAGGTVTDDKGKTKPLRPEDTLIVAPYNLAVRCIAERVPDGVRVGTVDRFQGQEAPVVFYALTCSSGEDVPRGLDFLFDKNRLNVAVSRAQCLSVLVYSPRLLDAACPTLESMRLLDGVCRYVELAEAVDIGAFGTTTMQ